MTIEEYLDELCASLAVDPLRRDEIRLETHLHLRDRVHILRQQGVAEEEANAQALTEFGDPKGLAFRFNQTEPGASPLEPKQCSSSFSNALLFFAVGSFLMLLCRLGLLESGSGVGIEDFLLTVFLPATLAVLGFGLRRGQAWANPTAALLALALLIGFMALQGERFGPPPSEFVDASSAYASAANDGIIDNSAGREWKSLCVDALPMAFLGWEGVGGYLLLFGMGRLWKNPTGKRAWA
jgi:hypothetical protein